MFTVRHKPRTDQWNEAIEGIDDEVLFYADIAIEVLWGKSEGYWDPLLRTLSGTETSATSADIWSYSTEHSPPEDISAIELLAHGFSNPTKITLNEGRVSPCAAEYPLATALTSIQAIQPRARLQRDPGIFPVPWSIDPLNAHRLLAKMLEALLLSHGLDNTQPILMSKL
ncbi:hypothetical protein CERZMDRAFT_103649 [Cercospora zeae-maydis SCOH1-5]|uniref:Uncharacterized protein n=1 Tax=Cercospora zeae-maydis SCOH1-5 TaxID=717836 RepID=A0A6A6EYZ3_9PEZI|nr:hypothetical protein CERZMDRAFT_103649 [Cercospora zeae-maydis SCOH1-5]